MSDLTIYDDHVRFEHIERATKQKYVTRQQRRKPKPKVAKQWTKEDTLAQVAEKLSLENAFDFTYVPSKHEAGWVLTALQSFIKEELISDVVALVKGGKEANVYQCRAHDTVDADFLAAKVYRPKMFRQLRNDSMYKEGRAVLDSSGAEVTERDKRTMKAMRHKSKYGGFVAHQSWLQHEFVTLELLHSADASVPKPYTIADNAILMGFVGSDAGAGPILHSVNLKKRLPAEKIRALFNQTIDMIELMLQNDIVHGDLSAFNILFWEDEITFIDFPQATVASKNSRARSILQRDIQRVCEYFQRQGVRCRPRAIADALWHRYMAAHDAQRIEDYLASQHPDDIG